MRVPQAIEGKKYEEKRIWVRNQSGESVEAATFLVKPVERRIGLWTSYDYVSHIVNGLWAHGVEDQHVIDIALQTNAKATDAAAEQSRLISTLRNPNRNR